MSKFLVYINKGKEADAETLSESVHAILRESTPPGVEVGTFSCGSVQVAYSGKVSIHLDESLGLLVILSGYFRQVGSASEYSADAKDVVPFIEAGNNFLKSEFEGCFSLVICDLGSLTLFLMTDRFGTRPLYYNFSQRHLAASPETFLLLPWLDKISVPPKALTDSFWLGFIRAPESMVSGISKVEDNSLTKITREGHVEKREYPHPLIIEPDETLELNGVVERVEAALESEFSTLAKTNRKVAVLLSGGVDSSIMAAYAKRHFTECVAFTCEIEGFDNPELERAVYIAEKLGLKHQVVKLKLHDLKAVFSEVVSMLEGPSRHINNIVVRRIFQEIRNYDAIIGGDGADALFGTKTNRTISNIEKKMALARRVPDWFKPIISTILGKSWPGKHRQLQRILDNDVESLLGHLFAIEHEEREVSVARKFGVSEFSDIPLSTYESSDIVGKSLEANLALFLRCMLERNTRLSNDTGIPIYYPFLSEGMLSISRRLPYKHRFDDAGNAKPALRKVFSRLVDSHAVDWPKVGFVTPEKTWLTNPLKSSLGDALTNRGGINRVLGLNLDGDDTLVVQSSNRMMWWLMTLDASLIELEANFLKCKAH